jgi:Pyridoxamine 5'-phosphate oxidase
MTLSWPGPVDDILAGDQVAMLAYVTPARGVVLTPLTNMAVRDRGAGTITLNSSAGMWQKLERMRRNPQVALAFHSRAHGFTTRPEYVLVQGRVSLKEAHPDYPRSIRENWERFGGPIDEGRLWRWWLRDFYLRVGIEVSAERVLVWPDLTCRGRPEVHGADLPDPPPQPQRPPARGTGPRVDHERAAKKAAGLPHRLLGWVGADGFPVVVPAKVLGTEERGLALEVSGGLLPPGGRRAGLTAHSFARYTKGQNQRKHTGWLEAEPGGPRAVYAPHTEAGYRLPSSWFLFRAVAGFETRRRMRQVRRAQASRRGSSSTSPDPSVTQRSPRRSASGR